MRSGHTAECLYLYVPGASRKVQAADVLLLRNGRARQRQQLIVWHSARSFWRHWISTGTLYGMVRYQTLLMCVLIASGGSASAERATYSITLEEGAGASVGRPEECNSVISSKGGDLVEARVRYRGQCEGAGVAPQIVQKGGARYLKFATDPAYQGETRTRSELALTSHWFGFGEPVYIGFRIQIPEGMAKTHAFFYVMQFWQCSGASPIAGIRISRGHSHRVNFMTRGDSRAASMATYKLNPDTWTSFVIKAVVDPRGGGGSFAVWQDPDVEPEVYRGPYGYSENGTCRNRIQPPQRFRIKFGIYKGNESKKRYEVDYDDIRIGNSFDSVSPWIRRPAPAT